MGEPRFPETAGRTLLCTLLLPAGLLISSVRALILALRGVPRARIDRVYTGFSRLCLRLTGTQVEALGLEHVEPGRAYVIVPNHESNLDPFVLLATLDMLAVRFVVKRELGRIPVFGEALLRTGNVCVDRSNAPADVRHIKEQMSERDPAVSILFYAQGTRSRDGRFRPFRKGAFATAIHEGLPILPVATAGTFAIWKPNSFVIRKGSVVLQVGKPIGVDGLGLPDRDTLRERCEAVVRELRAEARSRLRARGVEPGGVD